MDHFAAMDLAHAEFEQRLSLVRDDQWELVTTCPEWTVRGLTNHVVAAARTYTLLHDGCSRERAGQELASDAVGSEPLEAFRDSASALRVAFTQPGALDRPCTHPLFDTTGARLLRGRATDVAVHTWDLARTLRVDEHLDPRLVEHALQHFIEVGDLFVKTGAVAPPPGPTDASVAPQTRLLRLAGRNP
jgi:uncharacterized protein (TIGR03086 family)